MRWCRLYRLFPFKIVFVFNAGFFFARRYLTFKARRERRAANARRLRRGIPQRRYTDHSRVKLQYATGSVGAAGYLRYRRVYRGRSDHNR